MTWRDLACSPKLVFSRGGWGRGRSSPAGGGSLSSAAPLCSPRHCRQRSWDAPWSDEVGEGADVHPEISSVPSSRHLQANLHLPEHHLDGRFWPLRPLLQVSRGNSLWQPTQINHPCPSGSLNLPKCCTYPSGDRVPPCPALHTELAPPGSRSFSLPSTLPLHIGTGYTPLTSPTLIAPLSQAIIHPEESSTCLGLTSYPASHLCGGKVWS